MKPSDFIALIAPKAQIDMVKTGVPASLTIAQAILESAWGESMLTRKGNNLFGIKGKGGTYPTKEVVGGVTITVDAQFRHYNSWAESIADHSRLLSTKRYRGLLGQDYKTACKEVAKAGYATDPGYAKKLINLIEQYALFKYDEVDDVVKIESEVFGRKSEGVLINGVAYVMARDLSPTLAVAWDNTKKVVKVN